ncbi:ODF2L protein, partial [Rhinoptilus africanus]|nr:ODF2L protein [Rhinoptilus africanus]
VQKLQTAVEELKSRCGTVLNENKRITENKCLEVDKVRCQFTISLLEVSATTRLLAEQPVIHIKLARLAQIAGSNCLRNGLSFSHEEDSVISVGSHSLEEENYNIQKKYEDLKRQLEKMEFQNEELVYQLKKEDENLQCSKLQLEEKIAEYNGLTRQLESALEEGRKMIAEELEKMSYKEQALQTKILALETEVREGQEEKKQLLCVFHHNEKHREVCLKELENSLQKSENKNQSIQNYVQFLKASYVTMF